MSEIIENFEETLLSINVEENYSKEDIDSIIESMKTMVKMVKVIHHTASDTSKQFNNVKILMSQTKKKLNDAELYIKHLENRINMLEPEDNTPTTTGDEDMDCGPSLEDCALEFMRQEVCPCPSPVLDFDSTDSVSHTDDTQDGGGYNVLQLTQSQYDLLSYPPPPPPTVPGCPSLDVENIQKHRDDFNQFKQHTIDETCRRTVLWSNFPSQIIESIKNRKESFYPLLRTQLKAYDLEHILSDSKKVSLVGKSLKVEYLDAYRAGYAIRHMRTHIGMMKQEIDNWGEDHDSIVAAKNIRFTRLTAAKYHKPRKTLEALAKQLEQSRKISFFDIFVLKNKIYLRTC